MFALRVSSVPLTSLVVSLGQASGRAVKPVLRVSNVGRIQKYASETRSGSRFARRNAKAKTASETIKSKIMAPAGDGAFSVGKGFLAGASALGLGALCFYGLGLSNEEGTLDRVVFWPDYVKQRVRSTYMYFGGGIGITALSAVAVSRNARLMSMMMRNSWLAIGGTLVAVIGSAVLARSIPYKGGFGAKHMAWLLHTGVMGAVIAPLTLMGGPLLLRAAWYTAGVVGGLSILAMSAPNEKFLMMGGPLACGFGVVFVSSLAGIFLPPTTALGAGLYSISIYGGLVLFSMFLLYDTQLVMKKAEEHPPGTLQPFDPINASLRIYIDALNIFIRIATILAHNKRK